MECILTAFGLIPFWKRLKIHLTKKSNNSCHLNISRCAVQRHLCSMCNEMSFGNTVENEWQTKIIRKTEGKSVSSSEVEYASDGEFSDADSRATAMGLLCSRPAQRWAVASWLNSVINALRFWGGLWTAPFEEWRSPGFQTGNNSPSRLVHSTGGKSAWAWCFGARVPMRQVRAENETRPSVEVRRAGWKGSCRSDFKRFKDLTRKRIVFVVNPAAGSRCLTPVLSAYRAVQQTGLDWCNNSAELKYRGLSCLYVEIRNSLARSQLGEVFIKPREVF